MFLRAQLHQVGTDQHIATLQIERFFRLCAHDPINFGLPLIAVQHAQIG